MSKQYKTFGEAHDELAKELRSLCVLIVHALGLFKAFDWLCNFLNKEAK